jgi:hypothetical protein
MKQYNEIVSKESILEQIGSFFRKSELTQSDSYTRFVDLMRTRYR